MKCVNTQNLPVKLVSEKNIPEFVQALFHQIGEDPQREGLKRTSERFAKAMIELTKGYAMSPTDCEGAFMAKRINVAHFSLQKS